MKICIIDDNVEILELLKNILEATGNEVFTVDNGRDGLSVILSEKFKLVILDITMPEFSGIDIVRYLDGHEKLKDQNILFLTAASVQDSEIQQWLDKGVKACLKKPADMDKLFEQVMKVEMA